ncbi:hypothetical protein ACQCSX_12200 [Pseudarthrobacter sp. P1]|uniref:hypothetical protein n=1 Tax=Pseudarthrobacter sp. P1 TaxID=3418418 RepID=UPI003CF0653C
MKKLAASLMLAGVVAVGLFSSPGIWPDSPGKWPDHVSAAPGKWPDATIVLY